MKKLRGPNGGARPGAGRKPGGKNIATLAKEIAVKKADEIAREIVLREWGPILEAQAKHAQGISYMVLRAPDGSFTRATDEKQIDAACALGANAFKIFTQSPNTQAFTSLRDTAFDKPIERHEHSGPDGGDIPISITDVLKQRHARHRPE